MKKILFILGLASLLVTGCGDFFDTAPSNKIPTAIAFRTVTDVDNAVNGLYDLMSGSGYYGAFPCWLVPAVSVFSGFTILMLLVSVFIILLFM